MNGITRYLFGSGQARKAVDDNVNKVDPRSIIQTVTLQGKQGAKQGGRPCAFTLGGYAGGRGRK